MRRLALPAVLLAAALSACGSSDDGAKSAAPADAGGAPKQTQTTTTDAAAQPSSPSKSPEDASSSESPSSSSSGQTPTPENPATVKSFGHRGSAKEQSDIAAVFRSFGKAVQGSDAAVACGLMSAPLKKQLAQVMDTQGIQISGCPRQMGRVLGNTKADAKENLRRARIKDIRVDGDRGYVVYRAPGTARGAAWSLPLVRDAGDWKVAAIAGQPVPPSS